jgi:hypothetical protein
MYHASSAYTGVPGRQQAPHDVRTSEGQAERPAHHPDILIMVLHEPQRITLQVTQVYTCMHNKPLKWDSLVSIRTHPRCQGDPVRH